MRKGLFCILSALALSCFGALNNYTATEDGRLEIKPGGIYYDGAKLADTNEVATIAGSATTEQARALSAEAAISSLIVAEKNRAEGVEAGIQTQVDAVVAGSASAWYQFPAFTPVQLYTSVVYGAATTTNVTTNTSYTTNYPVSTNVVTNTVITWTTNMVTNVTTNVTVVTNGTSSDLVVTGAVSPDVTGVYTPDYTYETQPAWRSTTGHHISLSSTMLNAIISVGGPWWFGNYSHPETREDFAGTYGGKRDGATGTAYVVLAPTYTTNYIYTTNIVISTNYSVFTNLLLTCAASNANPDITGTNYTETTMMGGQRRWQGTNGYYVRAFTNTATWYWVIDTNTVDSKTSPYWYKGGDIQVVTGAGAGVTAYSPFSGATGYLDVAFWMQTNLSTNYTYTTNFTYTTNYPVSTNVVTNFTYTTNYNYGSTNRMCWRVGTTAATSNQVDVSLNGANKMSVSDSSVVFEVLAVLKEESEPTPVKGGIYFNTNGTFYKCTNGTSWTAW